MLAASRDVHAAPTEVKESLYLDRADSGYMPIGSNTRWGSDGQVCLSAFQAQFKVALLVYSPASRSNWLRRPAPTACVRGRERGVSTLGLWTPMGTRGSSAGDAGGQPVAERTDPSRLHCAYANFYVRCGYGWVHEHIAIRLVSTRDWLSQDAVKTYTNAIDALARAMLPVYALALHQRPDFFDDKFEEPCWCLRLNHYPPNEHQVEIGIPPHADGDFCTFLLQDDMPGLSLLRFGIRKWRRTVPRGQPAHTNCVWGSVFAFREDRGIDGDWVQAPTRGEFSLLVNSGEKLQIFSNGLFRSTMHTASAIDPSRSRFSVPFFWSPTNSVICEPLEAFIRCVQCASAFIMKLRPGSIVDRAWTDVHRKPSFMDCDAGCSEQRPSQYEASVSGMVYSSGKKDNVSTYGGTGKGVNPSHPL